MWLELKSSTLSFTRLHKAARHPGHSVRNTHFTCEPVFPDLRPWVSKSEDGGFQPGYTVLCRLSPHEDEASLTSLSFSAPPWELSLPHRRFWRQRFVSSNYSYLSCLARKATEESTRFFVFPSVDVLLTDIAAQHGLALALQISGYLLSLRQQLPASSTFHTTVLTGSVSLTTVVWEHVFWRNWH